MSKQFVQLKAKFHYAS